MNGGVYFVNEVVAGHLVGSTVGIGEMNTAIPGKTCYT